MASAYVPVSPATVSTDHEQLTLTARIDDRKRERLTHYAAGGDVDRQSTAFGAFRRIRRDGEALLPIRAPDDLSPPFDDRHVAPLGFDVRESAPDHAEVSITLGLEEPRSRDPLQTSGGSFVADTELVEIGGGKTITRTLTWEPNGSQLGDYVAEAAINGGSDTALVTVSNAPWQFSFSAGTLSILDRQVGQVRHRPRRGIETIELPLRLEASQAAVLFAVGSRVPAAVTRALPEAPNTVIDTLPDAELSVSISAPATAELGGEYILRGWSVERRDAGPQPYDARLTLTKR